MWWQNGNLPGCIRGFDSIHQLILLHRNDLRRISHPKIRLVGIRVGIDTLLYRVVYFCICLAWQIHRRIFIVSRTQSPALNSNISIVSKALVRQFQEEITFGQKRIQDLLRMAQLISAKLELTDLQRWIEYELDGYPNIKSAPDYRTVVSTELQYFNPYHGWCTAVGHKTFRFAIVQPVTGLEVFAKRDHVEFASTKPVRLVSLSGDSGLPNMNQRYIISGSEFIRILGTVKNKLLAWSIELEQRNILGENMAFNEHEKSTSSFFTSQPAARLFVELGMKRGRFEGRIFLYVSLAVMLLPWLLSYLTEYFHKNPL